METITIKIDLRSKAGRAFKAMLYDVFLEQKGVEIVKEKSPYNPEFVKMVKKSATSKKRYVIDTNNIWGSLGLK